MPQFSAESASKKSTCHPVLQEILDVAIRRMDFRIDYGWRGKEDQEAAFAKGASDKHFPDSKHNFMKDGKPCSLAVDIYPCPFKMEYWQKTHPFYFQAGMFMAIAEDVLKLHPGVSVRWGGDWDGDKDFYDSKLVDCPHFELVFAKGVNP